jgi:hypothetical protein
MKTPDGNQDRDGELSRDPFEHFASQVTKILRRYRKKRKPAFIAMQLGYRSSRHTGMITKDAGGDFNRKLHLISSQNSSTAGQRPERDLAEAKAGRTPGSHQNPLRMHASLKTTL